MKPRSCAWRFASSMFVDSSLDSTFGCVSVCTKSVFVVIGGCVVVVVVVAAMFGTVIVAVSGCTVVFVGVVLCRQAGAAMTAINTSPQRNPFKALLIAFSAPYR